MTNPQCKTPGCTGRRLSHGFAPSGKRRYKRICWQCLRAAKQREAELAFRELVAMAQHERINCVSRSKQGETVS